MEFVELGEANQAFARGGNRLCFVDPRDPNRCIKVLRPDRTPEIRRRSKGLIKRFRPLSSFDENREEYRVWHAIERCVGQSAFELISRSYGFVDTNHGSGLVMDLIRDDDGKIALTLKQYLWECGFTERLKLAVGEFSRRWVELEMPSKKLLLHNILAKKVNDKFQIYVIDGLGWSSLLPLSKYSHFLAKNRSKRKIAELWQTIDELLDKKRRGVNFGYHGWLDDDQRKDKDLSHG